MIMPVRQHPDAPTGGFPVSGESSLAERVRIRLLLEPDLPAHRIRCHDFHRSAGSSAVTGPDNEPRTRSG
ncbi:MAG: hypothetical protein ACKO2L_10930 [Planctomycetaceae bacterium]